MLPRFSRWESDNGITSSFLSGDVGQMEVGTANGARFQFRCSESPEVTSSSCCLSL